MILDVDNKTLVSSIYNYYQEKKAIFWYYIDLNIKNKVK